MVASVVPISFAKQALATLTKLHGSGATTGYGGKVAGPSKPANTPGAASTSGVDVKFPGAVGSPIPDAPPVTIAFLDANRFICFCSYFSTFSLAVNLYGSDGLDQISDNSGYD